jgi:hypothetical protein
MSTHSIVHANDTDVALQNFRHEIGIPPPGLKELHRREQRKDQFANEKVKMKLFDAQGKVRDGCSWTIQRRQLSAKLLQELVSRSPIPGKVDYVQETLSNTIVWPPDMVTKCRPDPFEYSVVLRTVRRMEDIADDPHFAGTSCRRARFLTAALTKLSTAPPPS